jgi:hypothetical protein
MPTVRNRLRRRQAADALGVEVWTFDRMRRKGLLRPAEIRLPGSRTPYFIEEKLKEIVKP